MSESPPSIQWTTVMSHGALKWHDITAGQERVGGAGSGSSMAAEATAAAGTSARRVRVRERAPAWTRKGWGGKAQRSPCSVPSGDRISAAAGCRYGTLTYARGYLGANRKRASSRELALARYLILIEHSVLARREFPRTEQEVDVGVHDVAAKLSEKFHVPVTGSSRQYGGQTFPPFGPSQTRTLIWSRNCVAA